MDNNTGSKVISVSLLDGQKGFAVQPIENCPHYNKEQLTKITVLVEELKEKFFTQPCADCQNCNESWICIECIQIGCSRYVNEHMKIHNEVSKHPVGMSFSDLSFWCYECENYITSPTIAQFQQFLSKVKFQGQEEEPLAQMIDQIKKLKVGNENALTYDNFIKGLKDKQFKKIVILTGAGISVAAGIPDFRSPGTGLYDQLAKYNLPKPESIFELAYFAEHPQAFYTLAKEFLTSMDAKPTLAHKFIKELDKRKQLHLNFTQNIDRLEMEAGLSLDKVVQAHGHMRTAHCMKCREEGDIGDFKSKVKKEEIYYCPKCKDGLIKPDIIFFGEPLPKEFFLKWQSLPEADLLLVMGTSLKVMPFAMCVGMVKPETPIVLLNRDNVLPRRNNVLFLDGDIEKNVQKIMQDLNQ